MVPSTTDYPSIAVYAATGPSGRRTLRIAGEVDILTSHSFKEALNKHLTDSPKELVIDLTDVTFMDSSALHVLIEASYCVRADAGSVILQNPGHTIRRMLEVSGLLGRFYIED